VEVRLTEPAAGEAPRQADSGHESAAAGEEPISPLGW
jgi:hypothetical protein